MPQLEQDDAEAAPARDRRLDLRYVGPVDGCYTLSDRRDVSGDGAEIFPCRTLSISSSAVAVTGTVIGAVGDAVTAKLDIFGVIHGRIERIAADGFVFQIIATDEQKLKIAGHIDFLKRKAFRKQHDRRAHKRRLPRDPRSTLGLADGRVINCVVMDYSRGGVGIVASVVPEIGERVAIGRVIGRVVRHFGMGFGIEFDEVQPIEGLERMVTGYEVIPEAARVRSAA